MITPSQFTPEEPDWYHVTRWAPAILPEFMSIRYHHYRFEATDAKEIADLVYGVIGHEEPRLYIDLLQHDRCLWYQYDTKYRYLYVVWYTIPGARIRRQRVAITFTDSMAAYQKLTGIIKNEVVLKMAIDSRKKDHLPPHLPIVQAHTNRLSVANCRLVDSVIYVDDVFHSIASIIESGYPSTDRAAISNIIYQIAYAICRIISDCFPDYHAAEKFAHMGSDELIRFLIDNPWISKREGVIRYLLDSYVAGKGKEFDKLTIH